MPGIYRTPRTIVDNFGRVVSTNKNIIDFEHLINNHLNNIILFEDTQEDIVYVDKIILPRHYFIFVGNKDGELQYKPYEFNQYRIVITTYKDIITSIDSIG